jgi:hypothetical protein
MMQSCEGKSGNEYRVRVNLAEPIDKMPAFAQ